MTGRRSDLTLAYALGVAVFLLGLGFLPSFFSKTNFEFKPTSEDGSTEVKKFPVDRPFAQLESAGKNPKNTTLQTLFRTGTREEGHTRALLVNFWATWCPPCIEELPSLETLNRQLLAQKNASLPRVVSISVDGNLPLVSGLFRTLDFKTSFPVLHDPNGEFASSVGTVRFPETYLIASDGSVLYKWVGPQNWVSEEFIGRLRGLTSFN